METVNKLITSCSKLTLDKFQDCLFENDLQVLIIAGTATEEQLIQTWNNIFTEYCALTNEGIAYNEVFEVSKEIINLNIKIALVNGIVKHLDLCYDKQLVDILNELALRCDITVEDKGEVLERKLNTVIGRSKKWCLKLKQREGDLEKLRTKSTGKLDRNYFDDLLEALSSFKGYQVEASKITVSRFCRSLNKMAEHYQREEIKSKTK